MRRYIGVFVVAATIHTSRNQIHSYLNVLISETFVENFNHAQDLGKVPEAFLGQLVAHVAEER